MQQYTTLYFILIFLIVIVYLITLSSFKNGYPTCNNYVINVYLYLALSLLLVGLFSYLFENIITSPSNIFFVVGFLMNIISLIFIAFSSNFSKNYIYSHVLWIIFIISFSLIIFPTFEFGRSVIKDAILSTSSVFTLFSLIVYLYPSFFKKTYGFVVPGLFIGLFSIILIHLLNMIVLNNSSINNTLYYVSIMLFSLFVSYDTSEMFEKAKQCVSFPNYPKSSIDFFLDIFNLFVNFIGIFNGD